MNDHPDHDPETVHLVQLLRTGPDQTVTILQWPLCVHQYEQLTGICAGGLGPAEETLVTPDGDKINLDNPDIN